MFQSQRRYLLKAFAALPFTGVPSVASTLPDEAKIVAAGTDRSGVPHNAVRSGSHLDFKVLTAETNGAMFILENRNMIRGGPPRHVHFEQEEWFYLVEGGEVVMEVGDQKLRLKPGDSILAPRNVPHVWTYLGDQPGRMLFAFTPAGKMEAFFNETRAEAGACSPRTTLRNARYEADGTSAARVVKARMGRRRCSTTAGGEFENRPFAVPSI